MGGVRGVWPVNNNATTFYRDVSHKQGFVYDSGIAEPVTRLINLGGAEIHGAELELYIDNLGPIVAGEDDALGKMDMPQWYGVEIGMNF